MMYVVILCIIIIHLLFTHIDDLMREFVRSGERRKYDEALDFLQKLIRFQCEIEPAIIAYFH